MKITRRAEFSASHFCANPKLTPEENHRIYGEAANLHGHGHNYTVEVTLDGDPDSVTGMVMDLKVLKEIIDQEVIEPMDHRFLNHEVKPFDSVVPTTENLAREIWSRLRPRFENQKARLDSIRVFETEDLWVEYSER